MKWLREELAWAAGLIEGEGCVSRTQTTERSRAYNYWHLRVASTDLDVLEHLRRVIGFGRIYKQTVKDGCKPAWQWVIYVQPEVYAVLVAMVDFMGARRRARMLEALREMGARGPWRKGRRVAPPQHDGARGR